MKATVGLDIGATAVRAVRVRGIDADGYAVVTNIGVVPLRPGAVSGGRVRQPQIVSLAMARALREAGLSKYGVIVGFSGPDSVIGEATLPHAVKGPERLRALRSMGHDIAPTVPLADSFISAQLVSTDRNSDGHLVDRLSVAAATRSEIEGLRKLCKLAGITPRAIDLSGAAVTRALVRCQTNAAEVASIVDLGASKIMVTTRQGPWLRSMRTVAGGGDDITKAISSVTSGDLKDAEMRKASMRLPTAPVFGLTGMDFDYVGDESEGVQEQQTAVEEALARAAEHIVDQVAQSIDADTAMYTAQTQGISLCGSTALLKGLKERLGQRMGVPVQIGRPWAVIAKSKKTEQYFINLGGRQVEDPRLMLSLATAIGLALWKESN